jgi:hypothetical protein
MATAIAALEEHERRTGRVQHRAVPERFDPRLEAQIGEIEAAGELADALVKKLRALPDVPARVALMETGAGKCVGRYERALEATVAGPDVGEPLRRVFVDRMHEDLIGELVALCGYDLSGEVNA